MPLKLKEDNFKWSWKSYDQLTKDEIYEILSFRQTIFVVEQQSWYLDADGLDECSDHLLLKSKGQLIGYLRLVPPGKKYLTSSIGRISISKDYRDKGLGSALVNKGLERTQLNFSSFTSTISAQEYLIKFYEGFGFKVVGDVYDEDGIPHVEMLKDG